MWNLEGEIIEANESFFPHVEIQREISFRARTRTDLTPAKWRDPRTSVVEIKTTGAFQPFQKEYFRRMAAAFP